MKLLMQRAGICLFLCLFVLSGASWARESEKKSDERGNLPEEIEAALTSTLDATTGKNAPDERALREIANFVLTSPAETLKKAEPKNRTSGSGVLYTGRIKVSLETLMNYILDPAVPGESLYPNSVRRNDWKPGSELLTAYTSFLKSPLPPATTLVMRGTEEEETTPDTSSGCHYSYDLKRLFVLMDYEGKSVLFSVSYLPSESSVGLKGVIVGDDARWNYVYTNEPGTNLPLLGWANTHLYGSASVTLYVGEGTSTSVYTFKWAKAGWAGSNVVKTSHIREGLERFVTGLRTVMESPKRPTAEAIKTHMAELNALDDEALRSRFRPVAETLKADPALKSGEYKKALEGDYPAGFDREQLLAELIKHFMRSKLQ